MHPCKKRNYDWYSNCGKGTLYKNGRRYILNDKDFCFSIPAVDVRKMSFYSEDKLTFAALQYLFPLPAANDWDGWSNVRHFGQDIMTSVASDVTLQIDDKSESDFPSLPSWLIGGSILSYISIIISIVPLVLTACKR